MYAATLSIEPFLSPVSIPLSAEMSVRTLVETAFVIQQCPKITDPFTLTIAFYGYDYSFGDKAYLGYLVVSISQGGTTYANSATNYWELFIDGCPSMVGMDSVMVKPGMNIEFRYVAVGSTDSHLSKRVARIHGPKSEG